MIIAEQKPKETYSTKEVPVRELLKAHRGLRWCDVRHDPEYCWEIYQQDVDRENCKASDDFKAAVGARIWKW